MSIEAGQSDIAVALATRPSEDVAWAIRSACQRLFANEEAFLRRFSGALIALAPRLRDLPDGEGGDLAEGLGRAVLWAALTDDPADVVEATFQNIGADYAQQGFPTDGHHSVGHALLRAARDTYTSDWTSELSSGWVAFYGWLGPHLQRGAARAAATAAASQVARFDEPPLPAEAPAPPQHQVAERPFTQPQHAEPRHTQPPHAEPQHAEPRHTQPPHAEPLLGTQQHEEVSFEEARAHQERLEERQAQARLQERWAQERVDRPTSADEPSLERLRLDRLSSGPPSPQEWNGDLLMGRPQIQRLVSRSPNPIPPPMTPPAIAVPAPSAAGWEEPRWEPPRWEPQQWDDPRRPHSPYRAPDRQDPPGALYGPASGSLSLTQVVGHLPDGAASSTSYASTLTEAIADGGPRTLDEVLDLLRSRYFLGNERSLGAVLTRVALRTGADLRAARPDQRADPAVVADVMAVLQVMGYTVQPAQDGLHGVPPASPAPRQDRWWDRSGGGRGWRRVVPGLFRN